MMHAEAWQKKNTEFLFYIIKLFCFYKSRRFFMYSKKHCNAYLKVVQNQSQDIFWYLSWGHAKDKMQVCVQNQGYRKWCNAPQVSSIRNINHLCVWFWISFCLLFIQVLRPFTDANIIAALYSITWSLVELWPAT